MVLNVYCQSIKKRWKYLKKISARNGFGAVAVIILMSCSPGYSLLPPVAASACIPQPLSKRNSIQQGSISLLSATSCKLRM
jgi:hypothetical protein